MTDPTVPSEPTPERSTTPDPIDDTAAPDAPTTSETTEAANPLDTLWAPESASVPPPASVDSDPARETDTAPPRASASVPIVPANVAAALTGCVSGAGVGIWAVTTN